MGIHKPRIAGQPTKERKRVFDQPFFPYPVAPGQEYQIADNGNLVTYPGVTPDWEGRLYFHEYLDSENNRQVDMYVAVNTGSFLEWKMVIIDYTINGYTGKRIDPIYD